MARSRSGSDMQSRAAGGPSYGLPLEHVRLLQLSAECDSRSPRQRAMRAAQLVRWIHCRVQWPRTPESRHIANAVHAVLGSAGTKTGNGQRRAFKPPESELYPLADKCPSEQLPYSSGNVGWRALWRLDSNGTQPAAAPGAWVVPAASAARAQLPFHQARQYGRGY
jgi:hypothetical protein